MGTKERRSFSEEFKRDAVRRAEAGGHSFTHIARELGIHPSLLQTWRRKHASAQVGKDKSTAFSSSDDEIRRLKRENAALREDRDILKKAAAFFAKESR
jgi:transposase